jgi:hypothetical protein
MEELKLSRFKDLPRMFRKNGYKVGAEIGVARGFYSKWICFYNPGLKLYCIDAWLAYDDGCGFGPTDQPTQDANYKKARERLAAYNCEFIRASSMDAVKCFTDGSLDFIYIDSNHMFEYVVEDTAQWSKKVRPGGMVAGHDFQMPQVREAILGYTKAKGIKKWYILTGDKSQTWFWIKE